jgi:hypothetical protein
VLGLIHRAFVDELWANHSGSEARILRRGATEGIWDTLQWKLPQWRTEFLGLLVATIVLLDVDVDRAGS